MYKHEKDVRKGIIPHKNKHLYNKIKKLISDGGNVIYKKILENVDENTSLLEERNQIKKIQNNGVNNPMYNKKHSRSSIIKMSHKRRMRVWSYKHSKEHRESMRKNNAGGIFTSKPLYQLDLDKNIIVKWNSLSQAAHHLKLSKGNISMAIKNNWQCKGYRWKYVE